MNERIEIENNIKSTSRDLYYSVTDVYGMDLFARDFREKKKTIEENVLLEKQELQQGVFEQEKKTAADPYEKIISQMFLQETWESRYREQQSRGYMGYAVTGSIIACIFTAVTCRYFIRRRERRQKSDPYIRNRI
ncbi:MAG: hypothetical protein QM697_09915 [Lachnospiraceae bacterium]